MTNRFHPWCAEPSATVLADEGFRLFFPLAALHAALWPFLWVVAHGFDLPLAESWPGWPLLSDPTTIGANT